jgi:outer membrane protein OmpA-like peptidoglycan-associated protein
MSAVSTSSALALALVAALAAGACDHVERDTSNPAQATWTGVADQMTKRLSTLRSRQTIVSQRASALSVPEGTEDANLTSLIADVNGRLGLIGTACDEAEAALAQARTEAEAALAQARRADAERAIRAGADRFAAAASKADAALAEVEPRLTQGEALMQRLLDGIRAEVARLTQLAKQGGNLDFSDIDFRVGSSEFDFTRPISRATLNRLVGFGQSCPELRFAITGHTSKEGTVAGNRALSLARAEAVKTYLVGAGVGAEKIVRTAGLGSAQPLAAEPEPGTPAEAATPRDQLEAARRTNRRVNIDVVTPCPAGTAEIAPPPTAPTPPTAVVAPADPHAGHNH